MSIKNLDFSDYFLLSVLILMIGLFILLLVGSFELASSVALGETITIYEECKNNYGQIIVGSECKREVKCLDWSIYQKTCQELRE